MNILGLTFWEGAHDAAAAVVCDGEVIAAAEEERFSRKKHDGDVPLLATEHCLRQAGLDMSQIDAIAFPHKPYRSGPDSSLAEMDWYEVRTLCSGNQLRHRALVHKAIVDLTTRARIGWNLGIGPPMRDGLSRVRTHFGSLPPVHYYGHHQSHAAAVFLTSGLEDAAILTMDGRGGPHATAAWRGRGRTIEFLAAEPYTNSLGWFYRDVTGYLGLGSFGEGKAMGLAPYGDPETFRARMAQILDPGAGRWYTYRRKPDAELLGFAARTDEPVTDDVYADFAAAAQEALERAIQRTVGWLVKSGSEPLCLSGGVSLNCTSNGRLRALAPERPMKVFPAAGDAGLGIGAALLLAAERGEPRPAAIDTAYWGPEFTNADCEAALQAAPGVCFTQPRDLSGHVAERLAAGLVVGWFQGRMEMGPRALGNRSILADPRTVAMRDRVNRVKRREMWRPLSPVVLTERAGEWFEMKGESPFMLFAVQVRAERASSIAAVVHVDGSARVQTVGAHQNARLHGLISAFERRTGVPLLLNTSFNAAGEPIVCTPGDAVNTFLNTEMDVLVLGDFVVTKGEDPLVAQGSRSMRTADCL